ncbi:MAG TPA: hypothetical protein VEM32_00665, partial [Geobacteraceae bacterium]|nr:hypothetical protein [Geobacteraceae bacterium]
MDDLKQFCPEIILVLTQPEFSVEVDEPHTDTLFPTVTKTVSLRLKPLRPREKQNIVPAAVTV